MNPISNMAYDGVDPATILTQHMIVGLLGIPMLSTMLTMLFHEDFIGLCNTIDWGQPGTPHRSIALFLVPTRIVAHVLRRRITHRNRGPRRDQSVISAMAAMFCEPFLSVGDVIGCTALAQMNRAAAAPPVAVAVAAPPVAVAVATPAPGTAVAAAAATPGTRRRRATSFGGTRRSPSTGRNTHITDTLFRNIDTLSIAHALGPLKKYSGSSPTSRKDLDNLPNVFDTVARSHTDATIAVVKQLFQASRQITKGNASSLTNDCRRDSASFEIYKRLQKEVRGMPFSDDTKIFVATVDHYREKFGGAHNTSQRRTSKRTRTKIDKIFRMTRRRPSKSRGKRHTR